MKEKDKLDKLIKSEDTAKLYSFMNSKEIQKIKSEILKLDKVDNEIKELIEKLTKAANIIYYDSGDDTGLTDTEYDYLVSLLDKKEINKNKEEHSFTILRGTLSKIYALTDEDVLKNKSQKSIEDWVASNEKLYKESTGNSINLYDEEILLMPKFDGVSCVIEIDENQRVTRALTRGNLDNNKAKDITHIISEIFTGDAQYKGMKYAIKTELMMLDNDLDKYNETYNKDYKNTRSAISGITSAY